MESINFNTRSEIVDPSLHPAQERPDPVSRGTKSAFDDPELGRKLENYSLESIIELKLSQFLDQIGAFYPEQLYSMILKETEKPLLNQILRRTGGNQVHAARILGINRNTLRKKMRLYGFR